MKKYNWETITTCNKNGIHLCSKKKHIGFSEFRAEAEVKAAKIALLCQGYKNIKIELIRKEETLGVI